MCATILPGNSSSLNMMIEKFKILVPLFLFMAAAACHAERADTAVLCPVSSAYMLEIGRGNETDTYLSPLKYSGSRLGLTGQWSKTLTRRCPAVAMQFDAALDGGVGVPHGRGGHTLYSLTTTAAWSALYTFRPLPSLTLMAGGGPAMTGGVLYLPSNSNNPADAVARADMLVRLQGGWRTRIGRLPVRVVEQIAMPLFGVMFAPQYGETYWEISLGNHHHLSHFRHWGSDFALDNLLAIDLGLGRNTLRLGWRFRLEASYAGHNDRQTLVNAFVIGLSTDCLRARDNRPKRTIEASL